MITVRVNEDRSVASTVQYTRTADESQGRKRYAVTRSPESGTRRIPLSQGKVAIVDDIDYESLGRFTWYADKDGNTYYARRNIKISPFKSTTISMHRVILGASDGVQVDHINRNGLDNRRSNLRLCTHAENQRHQRLSRRNTTGFKGVTKNWRSIRNPFVAKIRVENKLLHLGHYHTADQAARAYDRAALKYHGDFALTNGMLRTIS